MEKKLTRSRKDRMVAGVMGGLGEFFAIDATLIRLAYLIVTVFTGLFPGIIGYGLAILIVPDAKEAQEPAPKQDDAEAV